MIKFFVMYLMIPEFVSVEDGSKQVKSFLITVDLLVFVFEVVLAVFVVVMAVFLVDVVVGFFVALPLLPRLNG